MEHIISVANPGQDQSTDQGLCKFFSQQVWNVLDGLCMVIAQSHHCQDMLVKCQMPTERDPSTLIPSTTGRLTPAMGYTWLHREAEKKEPIFFCLHLF